MMTEDRSEYEVMNDDDVYSFGLDQSNSVVSQNNVNQNVKKMNKPSKNVTKIIGRSNTSNDDDDDGDDEDDDELMDNGRETAATKIQALQRGKKSRQRVKRDQAARTIQARQRKRIQNDERKKSAIKIQSMQRKKMAKRKVQNERAARTIQAAERKRSAQKKHGKKKNRKKEKKWSDELDESAIKIQSMQRKKMAKRKVQNERAARTIQAAERRRTAQKKTYKLKKWSEAEPATTTTDKTSNGNVGGRASWETTYNSWGDRPNRINRNTATPSELVERQRGYGRTNTVVAASALTPSTNSTTPNHDSDIPMATEFFEPRDFPAIDNILNESMLNRQNFDHNVKSFAVHRQELSDNNLLPPPTSGRPEDLPPPPPFLIASFPKKNYNQGKEPPSINGNNNTNNSKKKKSLRGVQRLEKQPNSYLTTEQRKSQTKKAKPVLFRSPETENKTNIRRTQQQQGQRQRHGAKEERRSKYQIQNKRINNKVNNEVADKIGATGRGLKIKRSYVPRKGRSGRNQPEEEVLEKTQKRWLKENSLQPPKGRNRQRGQRGVNKNVINDQMNNRARQKNEIRQLRLKQNRKEQDLGRNERFGLNDRNERFGRRERSEKSETSERSEKSKTKSQQKGGGRRRLQPPSIESNNRNNRIQRRPKDQRLGRSLLKEAYDDPVDNEERKKQRRGNRQGDFKDSGGGVDRSFKSRKRGLNGNAKRPTPSIGSMQQRKQLSNQRKRIGGADGGGGLAQELSMPAVTLDEVNFPKRRSKKMSRKKKFIVGPPSNNKNRIQLRRRMQEETKTEISPLKAGRRTKLKSPRNEAPRSRDPTPPEQQNRRRMGKNKRV
jgi:hypothetical protein